MGTLDERFKELISIHESGKLVPEFERSLNQVLAEHAAIERVSLQSRYGNVARGQPPPMTSPGKDLGELMRNQREDLAVLRRQMKDTIEAYRAVLPVADKGEFAALMLSGRAGFADKIQQSVDMVGVFQKSYTRGCMTTIAATMHAYPAGLQWLKDSTPKGPTPMPDKPKRPEGGPPPVPVPQPQPTPKQGG